MLKIFKKTSILLALIFITIFIFNVVPVMANEPGSMQNYGGVTYNILKLDDINNYIEENYSNIAEVTSAQSVFVGVRRWQTEKLAYGVEVEHIENSWQNNEHIGARAATTGYLATVTFNFTDSIFIKAGAGAYSSTLDLFNDMDSSDSGLDFGYKLGLYLPVSAEDLGNYLPFSVSENVLGDVYIGYRNSKVDIDNDYVNSIDYSGLEISTSLNISF